MLPSSLNFVKSSPSSLPTQLVHFRRPTMAFVGGATLLLPAPIRSVPSRRPRKCTRRCARTRITAKAESEEIPDDYSVISGGVPARASLPDQYTSAGVSASAPTVAPTGKGETEAAVGKVEEMKDGRGMIEMVSEEGEVCVGDFLWSPSLNEYREQREAGLLSSAIDDHVGEWGDVWMLAVSEQKGSELRNQYSRVSILVDRNFSDFHIVKGCLKTYKAATLDEISMFKARAVYEATGLPAIAETHDLSIDPPESGSRINKTLQQGYYSRNVEDEADAMIDRVRPISDDNRMTRFTSSAAYYDGEVEIVKNRTLEVAIAFSAERYSIIATTSALDELYKEHTRRFGLILDSPWSGKNGGDGDDEGEHGKVLVGATLLKERILRDGKMLDEGILKVSAFMNHMVDADLMEVCGEELAERLRHTMPNKLLTVESTGLIVGLPTARSLGIPLVFARKSRPITISDSYQTTYRSATKGTTNELIVSCEYLDSRDRVLIIDDFLAGGSTAEGLFKLAKLAHAKVVGVGVLIEKMSDGGRAFLSGYDVPVESLAKLQPAGDKGRIIFVEEGPWVNPLAIKNDENKVKEEALKASAEFYTRGSTATGGIGNQKEGLEIGDIEEGEEDGVEIMRWEDDEEEEELLDEIEEGLIREVGKF